MPLFSDSSSDSCTSDPAVGSDSDHDHADSSSSEMEIEGRQRPLRQKTLGICSESENLESESDSSDESLDQAALLKIRNYKRTEKARLASMQMKAERRQSKGGILHLPVDPAEEYRSLIKADSALNEKGTNTSQRFQRLRLLVSYLRTWALTITAFFTEGFSQKDIHHTLLTSIIDDTNMRLSGRVPGCPEVKKSRVVSVMNHVQSMVVSFSHADDASNHDGPKEIYRKHFKIHTPMVCLPKADADAIANEFVTRLLMFLGCVARRFQQFGLAVKLSKEVTIQTVCCCFDSLVTNLAMLKRVRIAVHKKQQATGHTTIYPFLGIQCQIHQLALTRKPLLSGFVGFWSSIVRLAHLFEIHSFRAQFRSALLQIIAESFSFIPCAQVPSISDAWMQRRKEVLQFGPAQGDRPGQNYQITRLRYHKALMQVANGDIDSLKICHWCVGSCCKGATHEQKHRHALLQTSKYLTLLFGFGFPVPLLYRWLHAGRALQFCKATWQHRQ